jgi:hypothetical protein
MLRHAHSQLPLTLLSREHSAQALARAYDPTSCHQVYLENPKPEEGAEDDPAIMTSHIIRAPPVLCAQVGALGCP